MHGYVHVQTHTHTTTHTTHVYNRTSCTKNCAKSSIAFQFNLISNKIVLTKTKHRSAFLNVQFLLKPVQFKILRILVWILAADTQINDGAVDTQGLCFLIWKTVHDNKHCLVNYTSIPPGLMALSHFHGHRRVLSKERILILTWAVPSLYHYSYGVCALYVTGRLDEKKLSYESGLIVLKQREDFLWPCSNVVDSQ